ncbi:RNA export mediator Gle1 [Histoplasma ohiense]|nr:RNA export mediator Gle1 [Histoplasma ohiense (nom. inval.)]
MGRPQLYSPRQPDSPSRQLILELARDLEQVRLHSNELKKVRAYERKSFYENLDRLDREKEEVHNAALSAAAAKRDALRLEAEETLQLHLRAEEEEKRRKEELERQKREKIEREKAERERWEREEAARVEAVKKAQEEEKRRKAEEAERARRASEEEKAKRDRERAAQEQRKQEEAKKEQAEAKAAEEKRKQQQQQAEETLAAAKILGVAHRTPQQIAEHQRYLELHQHLKKFRRYMIGETKKNPILKQHMGDMRRTIKKCVGQLVADDKIANRTPTNEITTVLKKALALTEPSVDIREFLAFPPQYLAASTNEAETKAPALLLYLLNIFSKAIIAQLIAEAGITPKYAEPLGVLTAQIFSMESFTYSGISMIDVLLAKYHAICPVLWGFYGNEATDVGKEAIGWWRERDDGRRFIPPQTHEERMIGLGAGFAAISLRNFSKTTRKNPMPNTHFWRACANILNVPPGEVQDTHLLVLSALLRHSALRIVGFWGDVGLALLRAAVVEFPAGLGERKSAARASVEILRDVFVREKCILL